MKAFLKAVGRHSVDVALGGIILCCLGLGILGDLLRMVASTPPPKVPEARHLHDVMGRKALEWWLAEKAQADDSAARLDAFQEAAEAYLRASRTAPKEQCSYQISIHSFREPVQRDALHESRL